MELTPGSRDHGGILAFFPLDMVLNADYPSESYRELKKKQTYV
jgi:hypothetical protein